MANDEWTAYVDTSDEWITRRTGIRRRRIAAPEQSTVDLAAEAATVALADAGLTASDLDEMVVATDTPEVFTPDTASFLQHRLGAREIPAYDLAGSGCAGFIMALDVAHARAVRDGGTILVVGVELIMRHIDWHDRSVCVLFGDAAGAVIVGPGGAEVLASVSGTDGSRGDILGLECGGTRMPVTPARVAEGAHQRLVMRGREVFKEAVRRMSAASEAVIARAGVSLNDVALVIPHQANIRIVDAVRRRLGVSEDRVVVNLDEYGNTGSASVPLALWEAHAAGRIAPGDLVLLTAFGAGFHWAAMLLRF